MDTPTDSNDRDQIHATCVAIDGWGVLLRGPSGAGKSDLALRLIDGGADLVADDRVDLARRADDLIASPPANLAGLLEVRGVGILKVAHRAEVSVRLLVDLIAPEIVERLPEPATEDVMGLSLSRVRLTAFEASAAAKVRLALRDAADAGAAGA